jgi:hypothetical protein
VSLLVLCSALFDAALLTQWIEQDEGAADAAVRIFGTSPVSNPHQRRCVPARKKSPLPIIGIPVSSSSARIPMIVCYAPSARIQARLGVGMMILGVVQHPQAAQRALEGRCDSPLVSA